MTLPAASAAAWSDPADLDDVLVDFLQMRPSADVLAATRRDGDERASQRAIVRLLRHPLAAANPPGRAYLLRLLRDAVLRAEAAGADVDDDLADAHADALLRPDDGWCFKTYVLGARASPRAAISLRLSPDMLRGGTGCHDWDAGFYLAELFWSFPELLANRRVVEIGAGAGVAAVAAADARPATLTLCDRDPEALANLAENLRRNGVALDETSGDAGDRDGDRERDHGVPGTDVGDGDEERPLPGTSPSGTGGSPLVSTLRLDWDDFDPRVAAGLAADLVVGADVLYDPTNIDGVLDAVAALIGGAPPPRGFEESGEDDSSERSLARSGAFGSAASDETDAAFVAETRARRRALLVTALRQPETLLAFERRARDRGFELSDVTARARPVDGSAFRRLDVDRGRMRVHVLEASQRTSNARARDDGALFVEVWGPSSIAHRK